MKEKGWSRTPRIYRMSHFNFHTRISRNHGGFGENLLNKSGMVLRGPWCHRFYLEKSFEGHVKVTSNFLNGTLYTFGYFCSLPRELSKTL